MTSETFRFCIVRGPKRISTVWCVELTADGFQVGTPLGMCRVVFLPDRLPRIHIQLPHTPYRAGHSEHSLPVDLALTSLPSTGVSRAISILFPSDDLSTFGKPLIGRSDRDIQLIEAAPLGQGRATEISALISRQPPDSAASSLDGFGTRLNAWPLTTDRYLYLYSASVPAQDFPARQPAVLPGIDIVDPITAGALTLIQTSTGMKAKT